MEHPVAAGIGAAGGRLGDGDQPAFALDHRLATAAAGHTAGLGAAPTGGIVAGLEGGGVVPAALGLGHAGSAAIIAGLGRRLHVGDGQLVDKTAGQLGGPAAIDLAVGGEADPGLFAGAGDADIGQPALFLEPLFALLVDAALGGEHAFLPAGQEDQGEFQALGPVQGHDLHRVLTGAPVQVHDQRHVLQIGLQVVEGGHGLDQFLQVLQAGLAGGGLVQAQGVGIAAFLQHHLQQAGVVGGVAQAAPAIEVADEIGQGRAGAGGDFVGLDQGAGG